MTNAFPLPIKVYVVSAPVKVSNIAPEEPVLDLIQAIPAALAVTVNIPLYLTGVDWTGNMLGCFVPCILNGSMTLRAHINSGASKENSLLI